MVLFFYPLDFTFVCPTEITAFSDRHADFAKLNCEVMADLQPLAVLCLDFKLTVFQLTPFVQISANIDWVGTTDTGCVGRLTVLALGLVPDR